MEYKIHLKALKIVITSNFTTIHALIWKPTNIQGHINIYKPGTKMHAWHAPRVVMRVTNCAYKFVHK